MKQSLTAFAATFGISLMVYAVLRQDCFYRHDGWGFFTAIDQGLGFHADHPFYMPMARPWCALLALVGIGTFAALGLFSAFGTAIAVAIHTLSLRRLGMKDPVLGTAWVGLCPAVLFFATVVEIHGVFLAFAAFCFYLTVVLVDRKSLPLAALLGISLALTWQVHASGILLPLVYLPWYLRRAGWNGRVIGTAVVAGLLAFTILLLVREGSMGTTLGGAGNVLASLRDLGAESHRIGEVLWVEWLWPFLPTSVLVVLLLFSGKWRVDAGLLLLTLVPYVLTGTLILQESSELGAYFLPWIFPASILCLESLGPRLARVLVLAGALLGIVNITSHERSRGVDPDWAARVVQTCGDRTCYVMLWDDWEMDSLLLHADGRRIQALFMRPYAMYAPDVQRLRLPAYGLWLSGREKLLVSARTREGLADREGSQSGPILFEWLENEQPHVLLDARGQRADHAPDPKDQHR